MLRLLTGACLLLAACKFDTSGLPAEHADGSVTDADASTCTPTGAEVCNGLDDDCDNMTDEDFPTLGMPCDGDDADDCADGTFECNPAGDGVVCNDQPGALVEVCDGNDNDCDGMTDEGFDVGMPCDGPDSDLCTEGVWQCDGAGDRECTDTSDDTLETCNEIDDDCDGPIDEDFDLQGSVDTCGDCFTSCVAANGTTDCVAGHCTPSCVTGAMDCNGNPNDGCELQDSDPVCTTSVIDLGSVKGDDSTSTTPTVVTAMGSSEAWYKVAINETNFSSLSDIEANVALTVPAGTDYDLHVYCASCGGTEAGFSNLGTGVNELVQVGNNDTSGNNSFTIYIEIRWFSASQCGTYTLTVTGNTNNGANNC